MNKERPQPSHEGGFEFTEREKLYDSISHERFKAIIEAEATTVHEVSLSSNNYGEFLFIITSRPKKEGQTRITFWGMGYHEYRERWLVDEWHWYEAYPNEERDKQALDKAEVQKILKERLDEISPQAPNSVQTKKGELFETIADLTDDDGAISEMDDIQGLLGDWDDPDI